MKSMTNTNIEARLQTVPGFDDGRKQRETILRLGEKMRDLRKSELGLSQREAAKLAGMEQPELSRIENGIGKRGPSYVTITRIINAYQSYLRQTDSTIRVGLNISVSHGDVEDTAQSLLTAS